MKVTQGTIYIFKIFKANDISSIDNLWRTVTIFSKEERYENKNEKTANWFTKQWQSLIWPQNYLSRVSLKRAMSEKTCLKVLMK